MGLHTDNKLLEHPAQVDLADPKDILRDRSYFI